MKRSKLLLGIFSLVFSIVLLGEMREMNGTLEERRGNIIFIKGEKEPYTGILVKEFLYGEIIGKLDIMRGLYNGELFFYHKNGQLYSKFKVIGGKFQDGSTKLYGKKGLCIGRITFKNGKMIEKVIYRGGKVLIDKNHYTLDEVLYEKSNFDE